MCPAAADFISSGGAMEGKVLSEKVKEWLKTTGFPLEMQAAAAFRDAGFYVRQSSTFSDPQSDKGREIDILATDPDWLGVVEISFVIECKSSSKPWVVLTSDDAFSGFSRLHAMCMTSSDAKEAIATRIFNNGGIKRIFDRDDRGGYGFRQALCKDADPAYVAAMSSLKACYELNRSRHASSVPRLSFSFPVIVVDSPLFECAMNSDGELVLTEVPMSEFLFSAYIPENVSCAIKVVSNRHLSAFSEWAMETAKLLRKELKSDEDRVIETLRKL